MSLEWKVASNSSTHVTHISVCEDSHELAIKQAMEESVEKAISLLANNIRDDSLYFLIEWHSDTSTVKITVTDDSKTKVSAETVSCQCHIDDSHSSAYALSIQDWVKDYLTTSSSFIRFSLVAVFRLGSQGQSILL